MFIQQRVPQQLGTSGSRKWIQRLIEFHPALLTDAVRGSLGETPDWTIEWISPRQRDQWAEYRDAGTLLHLEMPQLIPDLKAFWAPGGPQWDALGNASGKQVVLVEAKTNFNELTSHCGAAEKSRVRIDAALAHTKAALGAHAEDWSREYFQYAARLAHLEFFRERGVTAWLVCLYFYGDTGVGDPQSAAEWTDRLEAMHHYLGYEGDLKSRGVINVFMSVDALAAPER